MPMFLLKHQTKVCPLNNCSDSVYSIWGHCLRLSCNHLFLLTVDIKLLDSYHCAYFNSIDQVVIWLEFTIALSRVYWWIKWIVGIFLFSGKARRVAPVCSKCHFRPEIESWNYKVLLETVPHFSFSRYIYIYFLIFIRSWSACLNCVQFFM